MNPGAYTGALSSGDEAQRSMHMVTPYHVCSPFPPEEPVTWSATKQCGPARFDAVRARIRPGESTSVFSDAAWSPCYLRFFFSRMFTEIWIGEPSKPNSSRSERSM